MRMRRASSGVGPGSTERTRRARATSSPRWASAVAFRRTEAEIPRRLGEALVRRRGRPADDDEEHIKHEKGDSDVAEDHGEDGFGPGQIPGPEEKRRRDQQRLQQLL